MARPGGITEIEGAANSLEIDSLARYAVDEQNKKQNSTLQFVKVINAKQQVVSGTVYYIILEVMDGAQKKIYEAKVWVKPWLNFKQVEEFKLVQDLPSDSTAQA